MDKWHFHPKEVIENLDAIYDTMEDADLCLEELSLEDTFKELRKWRLASFRRSQMEIGRLDLLTMAWFVLAVRVAEHVFVQEGDLRLVSGTIDAESAGI